MPITLAVPKEILAGEQRVALVPAVAAKLADQGAIVRIEQGAGAGIRTPDSAYTGPSWLPMPRPCSRARR